MNLTVVRGDTKQLSFHCEDNDGNVITTKADKVYFTVKKSNLPTEYLLQKTISDMTFDDDGTYHFKLEASDTESLATGTYKYDIQINADGKKSTKAKGNFVVKNRTATKNLEMTRGDSETFTFTRRDKNGEPITRQANEVVFTVSDKDTVLFEKTLEDITFDNGEYKISIEPEDTDSLAFTSYTYALRVVDLGVEKTVANGKFTITEEVTFAENEG